MFMIHQLFSFLLAEDCTDGPKGGELLYRLLGESAGLLAYGLRPFSPVANGRTHPKYPPTLVLLGCPETVDVDAPIPPL